MRAFLVALGALALFVQPGPFLNDEVGQMAALTSLADGSLLVQPDLPDGYGPWRGWAGNVVPPEDGNPRPNAGSMMTAVLALPALFSLRALAVPFGPMGAVGLAVAAAAGGAVWAATGGRGPPAAGRLRSLWRGGADAPTRRLAAAGVVSALFLGALLMQVRWQPPASPYLEAAALQLVGIVFHALATALVYDLLRTRVRRPALGAGLYAFGTPALFWALALKYHGVAVALVAVAVWTYQKGHRTAPLRTGLAFAVAGLAIWNHLPHGLLLLASMGLMAAPSVALGWRPLATRAGAGVAGLGLGILPEVWDRMAHNALEARDRFIQIGGGPGGGGGPGIPDQVARQSEAGRLQWAVWNEPGGPFDAFWQMVFWPDRSTPHIGATLPLLALFPLVAVVAWAYRREILDRMGRPLMVWPAVHLLVLLLLFGRGVFNNGAGFDLRHASTLWPLAVVPAAAVLDRVQLAPVRLARIVAGLAFAMLAWVWVPFHLAAEPPVRWVLGFGPTYDLVEPLRYVGVFVAASLLAVWAVPRLHAWRPQAAALGVAWAVLVQVTLQLGPARNMTPGLSFPFVAWPMALLEAAAQWLWSYSV